MNTYKKRQLERTDEREEEGAKRQKVGATEQPSGAEGSLFRIFVLSDT
jgi:hypothetical protein